MRRRLVGATEIAAALDAGRPIARVLIADGAASATAREIVRRAEALAIPVSRESAREMRRMTADGAAAVDVLAVEGPPPCRRVEALMARPGLVLVLAGLRYPANVGFLWRSAEVAGAAGVVVDADWTDAAWTEARRVSIRADRFLSVVEAPAERAIEAAREAGRRVVAVETGGDATPWTVDLRGDVTIVLGSETSGIPASIVAEADAVVHVPTRGFIPSYNVQAAAGVVLGEWLRQTLGDASPQERGSRGR